MPGFLCFRGARTLWPLAYFSCPGGSYSFCSFYRNPRALHGLTRERPVACSVPALSRLFVPFDWTFLAPLGTLFACRSQIYGVSLPHSPHALRTAGFITITFVILHPALMLLLVSASLLELPESGIVTRNAKSLYTYAHHEKSKGFSVLVSRNYAANRGTMCCGWFASKIDFIPATDYPHRSIWIDEEVPRE